MRTTGVLVAVILFIVPQNARSQVVRRGNAVWVSPRPNQTYQLAGYEVTERFCSDDQLTRCVFIKRHFDRQPILFYTHFRVIVLTLGHRKRLVLINDWEATKSGKVVVENLRSGARKQIDKRAVAIYRRRARPDRRLIIVPEACEFSPDDKQVLIKIVKEDVTAATAEESIAASRTYKPWSYVVDSRTGNVIREFRSKKIPTRWWWRRSRARKCGEPH